MSICKEIKTSDVEVVSMENFTSAIELEDYSFLDKSINQGFMVVSIESPFQHNFEKGYIEAKTFFAKNNAFKMRHHVEEKQQAEFGNLGYFPFDSEKAKNHANYDSKEFFHVGRALFPKNLSNYYSLNRWPNKSFSDAYKKIYDSLDNLGYLIVNTILKKFNFDDSYIQKLLRFGNSVLRVIHYPPTKEGGVCAAPHTGIQLIGIQPNATSPGLEIKSNGNWLKPIGDWNNHLIINFGEMLEFLTDSEINATLHRVSSTDVNRYAMVHFYHPNHLSDLISPSLAKVNSGEIFKQRMIEISIMTND